MITRVFPRALMLSATLLGLGACAASPEGGEQVGNAGAAAPVAVQSAALTCQSYTATVAEHHAAGRVYDKYYFYRTRYYAVGSDEYLGTDTGAVKTLREDPAGYFFEGDDCPSECVPSTEVCDGVDNNCDGLVDEGLTNACGGCGPVPTEVCDGVDNNCDGLVDEGLTHACSDCDPTPTEVCDGVDNNCDGLVDEGGVCDVPACQSHTATIRDHLDAGRVYSEGRWFKSYYAVGSGESLGRDADLLVILREEPTGYFFTGEECACEGYLCMTAESAPAIDELITRCPPAEVLDAIDADLDIRFEYSEDLTGQELVCSAALGSRDLTRDQERVYQALIALRALPFNSPLPWTDKNLYAWLVDTIDGIRMRTDIEYNSCCTGATGGPGNYLNLIAASDRQWLATDLWHNGAEQGLAGLVGLIVHEARHNEDKPHTCGSANDLTLEEMGSWAAVYHFYDALAFDSDACFMRPTLPADSRFPGQMFGDAPYLEGMRYKSTEVIRLRICEPSIAIPDPPEPVSTCGQ